MQNPFTHTFGAQPIKYISTVATEEIIENFKYEKPSEKCYILTGVRGSGKTVMMSTIAKNISQLDGWVVYSLNSTIDMVEQLLAKLSDHPLCAKHLIKPQNIGLSLKAVSLGIEYNKENIFDPYTLISKMINTLSEHNVKILLTIDDVSANQEMKVFAHTYQQLITDPRELPVYLIMTGLYSNYKEIKDSPDFKGSTFLTRTFERNVEPLDEAKMAVSYCNTFGIEEKEGVRLAKLTKGFAFAYQLLGYWYFEKYINKKEDVINVEMEYRAELIKYCYAKLWTELSEKDKEIIIAMVKLDADKAKVKREAIINLLKEEGNEIKSSTFGTYKERLEGKGIIATSNMNDGFYWLTLPEFGNYVRVYKLDEDL